MEMKMSLEKRKYSENGQELCFPVFYLTIKKSKSQKVSKQEQKSIHFA